MLLIIEGKIVPVSITFALSILGIFGNLRVVFAAWTLRQSSTCHWFIFGRAILDILHQSGHFVTAFLVYTGKDTITHRICFILEFFPFAAVIGTSIVSLAIGIDRLIGFHMPFFYRRLNVTVYITAVYLITAGYALTFMTLFFLTSENMDEQWFCIPGSVISKAFMKPYLYAMAIIYAVTIIQYLSIWIPLFKHRKSMPGYMRIMKPITIVVCISLSGWLANFVFEIFVNSLNLNSMASTLWCGLTINLAVASDFWVYYIFSSDYRSTFAKQSILRKSRSCRIQTISK